MLRKASLEHDGRSYDVTIRNISATGALVEGLWDVPAGTCFDLQLAKDVAVSATAKWCAHGRVGVQFSSPLTAGPSGAGKVREEQAGAARHPRAQKAAR
jgi:hypothetical protein